jgi:single-stranded DNA-binding protein
VAHLAPAVVTWRRLASNSPKRRLVYIVGHPNGRVWTGRDGVKRYTVDIVASELSAPISPGAKSSRTAPSNDQIGACIAIKL